MSKGLNITFIDEESVKVIINENGKNISYIISTIEKDKASLTVMEEIKKVKKILNSSVLEKLDKTDKFFKLKAENLREEIKSKTKQTYNKVSGDTKKTKKNK